MTSTEKTFLAKSEIKAQDLDHRRKLNHSIANYHQNFAGAINQFSELETARKRAKNVKWKAMENLDTLLEQFETRFTARGGTVIWAEDALRAREEILNILKENNVDSVVKSHSNTTEEIRLNPFLKEHHIRVLETELGSFMQQLNAETPYHMVSPAIHKTKEDLARLLHDKLQAEAGLSSGDLALEVRKNLRKQFQQAGAGITGANFLIADMGGVSLTEEEGNIRLETAFPKIHIAVAGIDKMIPSLKDLSLFWPLLSTYGRGAAVSAYNSIFTGPRQGAETDGPEKMFVVILDNGRTKLLANERLRESLYCIRCGACLNADPVYKNIGGHAYGAAYTGPIGAVISPYLEDMEDYKLLSFASPVSGSGSAACPLKINLEEMMLLNRKTAVAQHFGARSEKVIWTLWKNFSLSRSKMNAAGAKTKSKVLQKMFKKAWGDRRTFPQFAPKSFNEQWKERNKT